MLIKVFLYIFPPSFTVSDNLILETTILTTALISRSSLAPHFLTDEDKNAATNSIFAGVSFVVEIAHITWLLLSLAYHK